MKWFVSVLAIVAFLAMLYSCALPGDPPGGSDEGGLPGVYTVNGVDPVGTEYSGTVVIRATDRPELGMGVAMAGVAWRVLIRHR